MDVEAETVWNFRVGMGSDQIWSCDGRRKTTLLQGLYSPSGKPSYRQISLNLVATTYGVKFSDASWQAFRQYCCRGPVKFQNDTIILTSDLAASRFCEVW